MKAVKAHTAKAASHQPGQGLAAAGHICRTQLADPAMA